MTWTTIGDILRVPALAFAGISIAILLPLIRARVRSIRISWDTDIFSLLLLDLGLALLATQEIIILILRVGAPPQMYGVFMVLPAFFLVVIGLYYRRELIRSQGQYMRAVEEVKRGNP